MFSLIMLICRERVISFIMSLEKIDQLKEETVKIKKVKATVFVNCKFCKAAKVREKNCICSFTK